MISQKHTRGPWAVNEDGFKVESAEEHGWVNDGWVICVTEGPDKEANARLIAAAPELLEALRMCYLNGNLDLQERGLAAAAIAKATGQ